MAKRSKLKNGVASQHHRIVRIRLRRVFKRILAHGDLAGANSGDVIRDRKATRRSSPAFAVPDDLKSWLLLYDEFLTWSIFLWGIYKDRFDQVDEFREQRLCCAILSFRITQDLGAVRDLVDNGFSIAANTVARSVAEHLDLLALAHIDKAAAVEFLGVDDNERANAFWHKYCSKGKIDKKIAAKLNEEPHESLREIFIAQRDNYLDFIGMSAHPSFPAGVAGVLDSGDGGDGNVNSNLYGHVTSASRFTLHFLMGRILVFGFLFVSQYWMKSDGIVRWDSVTDPTAKSYVRSGLSLLLWAMGEIDKPENQQIFFPEFRSYWKPQPLEKPI